MFYLGEGEKNSKEKYFRVKKLFLVSVEERKGDFFAETGFFKEIENDSLYVFDTKTETFGSIDVKADGEIGEVMRNMDKQFFFSVTGKDGTDDYILYNEKDVLQEKK